MNQRMTELAFVIDKSGSMSGLETDTIGGFNAMLEKQRAVEGDCRLTTVLFDHQIQVLHDRVEIQAVEELNQNDYQVGGSTALLDAIGYTVNKIENAKKHTSNAYQAKQVLIVIITDGQENSSRKFSLPQIKAEIGAKKEENWEFIFLGANIDAVETAGQFGIHQDRVSDYLADSQGTQLNYDVVSRTVAQYRKSSEIGSDWKQDIDSDIKKRSTT